MICSCFLCVCTQYAQVYYFVIIPIQRPKSNRGGQGFRRLRRYFASTAAAGPLLWKGAKLACSAGSNMPLSRRPPCITGQNIYRRLVKTLPALSVSSRFNCDHFKVIFYIIPSLTVILSYDILKLQKALPVTVGPVNSYKVIVNFAEWTVTFLLSELSDR